MKHDYALVPPVRLPNLPQRGKACRHGIDLIMLSRYETLPSHCHPFHLISHHNGRRNAKRKTGPPQGTLLPFAPSLSANPRRRSVMKSEKVNSEACSVSLDPS